MSTLPEKIVLASGNIGKIRELQALLSGMNIEVVPQAVFNIPEAAETGLSFVENAIIKARHAAGLSGLPALADDSGIAVDALQGQPGIYSARYAGAHASDADNNAKLLQALQNTPAAERTAHYHCVIAFCRDAQDPVPLICSGSWSGRILETGRGQGGFGYDPLFYIPALKCTAAELDPAEKNKISHRGQALTQLRAHLNPTRI